MIAVNLFATVLIGWCVLSAQASNPKPGRCSCVPSRKLCPEGMEVSTLNEGCWYGARLCCDKMPVPETDEVNDLSSFKETQVAEENESTMQTTEDGDPNGNNRRWSSDGFVLSGRDIADEEGYFGQDNWDQMEVRYGKEMTQHENFDLAEMEEITSSNTLNTMTVMVSEYQNVFTSEEQISSSVYVTDLSESTPGSRRGELYFRMETTSKDLISLVSATEDPFVTDPISSIQSAEALEEIIGLETMSSVVQADSEIDQTIVVIDEAENTDLPNSYSSEIFQTSGKISTLVSKVAYDVNPVGSTYITTNRSRITLQIAENLMLNSVSNNILYISILSPVTTEVTESTLKEDREIKPPYGHWDIDETTIQLMTEDISETFTSPDNGITSSLETLVVTSAALESTDPSHYLTDLQSVHITNLDNESPSLTKTRVTPSRHYVGTKYPLESSQVVFQYKTINDSSLFVSLTEQVKDSHSSPLREPSLEFNSSTTTGPASASFSSLKFGPTPELSVRTVSKQTPEINTLTISDPAPINTLTISDPAPVLNSLLQMATALNSSFGTEEQLQPLYSTYIGADTLVEPVIGFGDIIKPTKTLETNTINEHGSPIVIKNPGNFSHENKTLSTLPTYHSTLLNTTLSTEDYGTSVDHHSIQNPGNFSHENKTIITSPTYHSTVPNATLSTDIGYTTHTETRISYGTYINGIGNTVLIPTEEYVISVAKVYNQNTLLKNTSDMSNSSRVFQTNTPYLSSNNFIESTPSSSVTLDTVRYATETKTRISYETYVDNQGSTNVIKSEKHILYIKPLDKDNQKSHGIDIQTNLDNTEYSSRRSPDNSYITKTSTRISYNTYISLGNTVIVPTAEHIVFVTPIHSQMETSYKHNLPGQQYSISTHHGKESISLSPSPTRSADISYITRTSARISHETFVYFGKTVLVPIPEIAVFVTPVHNQNSPIKTSDKYNPVGLYNSKTIQHIKEQSFSLDPSPTKSDAASYITRTSTRISNKTHVYFGHSVLVPTEEHIVFVTPANNQNSSIETSDEHYPTKQFNSTSSQQNEGSVSLSYSRYSADISYITRTSTKISHKTFVYLGNKVLVPTEETLVFVTPVHNQNSQIVTKEEHNPAEPYNSTTSQHSKKASKLSASRSSTDIIYITQTSTRIFNETRVYFGKTVLIPTSEEVVFVTPVRNRNSSIETSAKLNPAGDYNPTSTQHIEKGIVFLNPSPVSADDIQTSTRITNETRVYFGKTVLVPVEKHFVFVTPVHDETATEELGYMVPNKPMNFRNPFRKPFYKKF